MLLCEKVSLNLLLTRKITNTWQMNKIQNSIKYDFNEAIVYDVLSGFVSLCHRLILDQGIGGEFPNWIVSFFNKSSKSGCHGVFSACRCLSKLNKPNGGVKYNTMLMILLVHANPVYKAAMILDLNGKCSRRRFRPFIWESTQLLKLHKIDNVKTIWDVTSIPFLKIWFSPSVVLVSDIALKNNMNDPESWRIVSNPNSSLMSFRKWIPNHNARKIWYMICTQF